MESILMFLIPKVNCEYIEDDSTLRQALEKMEYHRFSSIPVLDNQGRYVKTITDGDLLWAMKKNNMFDIESLEDIYIRDINTYRPAKPLDCNASMKEAMEGLLDSNFVPVVDDRGFFIGIITRKAILTYYFNKILV